MSSATVSSATITPFPAPARARRGGRRRGSRQMGRVTLTQRGRWAVVAAAVLAAFLLLSLGQVAAQAIGNGADEGSPTQGTWVVQPGETLWSIAERVDPGTDPRETVARLVTINDLPDSSVQVGQELQIPA